MAQNISKRQFIQMLSSAFLLTVLNLTKIDSVKLNQRIFVNDKAINSVDPTHDGFRVILNDEFIKKHLLPTLLPTLYLTAVLLESEEKRSITSTIYADSPLSGKQIHISGLKPHSWHYLCVEFETFNRQNETTGTDCEFHRTLDFSAKKIESTVDTVELIDTTSQSLAFSVKTIAEFERRLTFTLRNGNTLMPSAEMFYLDTSTDLDLKFSNLKPDKIYGQLCILEEPTIEAYTALGRKIHGLKKEKCHFGKLKTKDYDWSIFESEASPYSSSNNLFSSLSTAFLCIIAQLL